jgi:6-phosphogluconolactonase (cycloisomerase 2 family)
VYATSEGTDNGIATFSRNPSTGAISFVEAEKDGIGGADGLLGARGVAVSPDGNNVYVASEDDNAVAVFSRSSTTGALTFVEFEQDGVAGVDGLAGAAGVTVSPDGRNVYVPSATDNSLVAFSRDAGTGALTFVEFEDDGANGVDGLAGGRTATVSPDNRHVYSTGNTDDSVAVFSRDAGTGALTFVEFEDDGVNDPSDPGGTVDGLDSAGGSAISTDGKHLYVVGATDDSVAVFSRDSSSGKLSFLEFQDDGVGGVDGLDQTTGVAVSPDGAHVYASSLTDSAVAAFSRERDLTTPQTTGFAGPAATTTDNTPAFTFSSDDLLFARFECRVDLGPFESCTSPFTSFALADGPHRFQVRALDTAGNVDQTPAESNFTVDTTAPATTVTGGPAGTTADSTPSFEFSANDGGASFACRVDSAAFSACASPFTSAALADGSHRFQVRATDAAGNVEATPADANFTVDTSGPAVVPDTTAPDTELTSEPTAQLTAKKKTAKASFAFAASEAGSRFECRLDSASFSACTSPENLALKVGAHTFRVRAIDAAGNVDFSAAKWQGTVIKKKKSR